jgi:hypothetical protein
MDGTGKVVEAKQLLDALEGGGRVDGEHRLKVTG